MKFKYVCIAVIILALASVCLARYPVVIQSSAQEITIPTTETEAQVPIEQTPSPTDKVENVELTEKSQKIEEEATTTPQTIKTKEPVESESPHKHCYTKEVLVQETCVSEGIICYKCECSETYEEKIPAREHDLQQTLIEPTTETEGYTLLKCSICGYEEKINFVAKLIPHTHTYQSTITKSPTCTESGTKLFVCSCGHSYSEKIPAVKHAYEGTVVAATAEHEGYTVYTCRNCKDTYTDNFFPKIAQFQEITDEYYDPKYPYTNIDHAVQVAQRMILDFTNEVEKNPSDFYFTLYIRLEESQSLSNLGDVFWDKMFVHTGRPEEGDVFENRFLQRGFTYLIDREENGYRYIRVVFYGLLNTTKQQCEELMNSLDIGAKGTDYEKALAIYNWVTTHCEYGRTEIDGRRLFDSAYGARFHTATCNGISQLVYDMMLYAGVPCRIVHCNSHAWNIVKIDGQWYIVDATFGLPKNGPSYFLLGSNNYKKWADRYTDKLGGNIEIAKENYHS